MYWSDTFWLTVANIALGVAVGLFLAGTAGAIVLELISRHRRRSIEDELDRDMRAMFHPHPRK